MSADCYCVCVRYLCYASWHKRWHFVLGICRKALKLNPTAAPKQLRRQLPGRANDLWQPRKLQQESDLATWQPASPVPGTGNGLQMECIFKCVAGGGGGGASNKCNVIRLTWLLLLLLRGSAGWSVLWFILMFLFLLFFPLQRYNKLLCCLTGNGRHAGRPLCDDIQCICGAIRWQVDVWPIHVQRV